MENQFGIGNSVRSAQTALRTIAYHNENVPLIIPDGIFGEQTEEAVQAFQQEYGLQPTGIIDLETWDKMFFVLSEIEETEGEPKRIKVFPDGKAVFFPGDKSRHLLPIQALLYVLTLILSDFGEIEINGEHDEATEKLIRKIQRITGLEENGIIDKTLWDRLVILYESFVPDEKDALFQI